MKATMAIVGMFLSMYFSLSAYAQDTVLFQYDFECVDVKGHSTPFQLSVERNDYYGWAVIDDITTVSPSGEENARIVDPTPTGSSTFINERKIELTKVFADNSMTVGVLVLDNEIFNGGKRYAQGFYTNVVVSDAEGIKNINYNCTRAEQ
jgi:hypothetical protein